jgi:hypothetical protein
MKRFIKRLKLKIANSKLGRVFFNPVFELRYRSYGLDKVKRHTILAPFKTVENGFVAHSIGRGVRRFRNDRVVAMNVISLI